MKILKANDFISERVKVKPVTNAELDMVRKELRNTQKTPFVNPYDFLKPYIDQKVLDSVFSITKLRSGNIKLILRNDSFYMLNKSEIECVLYVNTGDYCWRIQTPSGTPSKSKAFANLSLLMAAFKKWIENKYNMMHK